MQSDHHYLIEGNEVDDDSKVHAGGVVGSRYNNHHAISPAHQIQFDPVCTIHTLLIFRFETNANLIFFFLHTCAYLSL